MKGLVAAARAAILIVGLAAVLAIGSLFLHLASLPRWELTAVNTDRGLRVEVFEEGEVAPTYRTTLEDCELARDIHRVTIDTLPPDLAETTFTDETVKPGRWTLVMDGVEVDIMETRLIIDGQTELDPKGK